MASIAQSFRRRFKFRNSPHSRTPALCFKPQIRGVVSRVRTMSPKKPNSASRHVAKVNLSSQRRATCRLPGIGYLCSKFNRVLVNGGRANDLPGIGYTLIRGALDFAPVLFKSKRRSVYGTERPAGWSKHIRRNQRSYRK